MKKIKLQTIVIVLVLFVILRHFISSPYKSEKSKKTETKLTVWPKGIVIAPLTGLNPDIRTYYAALKYYISQLQATSFTRENYSDTQWNGSVLVMLPILRNNITNFSKLHNKYANDPNILTNCDYLYAASNICGVTTSWIASMITADPGLKTITNGEYRVITDGGGIRLAQPFLILVNSLIGNSPC